MALNYQMIMKRYPKMNKMIGCLIPTHDSPSPFYLMEKTTQRDGHTPPLPPPLPKKKRKRKRRIYSLFFAPLVGVEPWRGSLFPCSLGDKHTYIKKL
jgi:hypothetical protein